MTDFRKSMGSHLNEEPTSGMVQLTYDTKRMDQWWDNLKKEPEYKYDENSPEAKRVDRWWEDLLLETTRKVERSAALKNLLAGFSQRDDFSMRYFKSVDPRVGAIATAISAATIEGQILKSFKKKYILQISKIEAF